jgi:hypothetical protein
MDKKYFPISFILFLISDEEALDKNTFPVPPSAMYPQSQSFPAGCLFKNSLHRSYDFPPSHTKIA